LSFYFFGVREVPASGIPFPVEERPLEVEDPLDFFFSPEVFPVSVKGIN